MIDRKEVERFPHAPGVYLMRDREGTVIYVGKARDLRRRVVSYFRAGGDGRPHVPFLMERVSTIDYLVTDTEKEALILENTLIKRHRPRYNFALRDDKSHVFLRLDLSEEFPRLTMVRRPTKGEGVRHFGPYPSASAAREVLQEIFRLFPLRQHPIDRCRRSKRPCLYHQIGRCPAPCAGRIGKEGYAELVEGAVMVLEGRERELNRRYLRKMEEASRALRYEEAARWRDLLAALRVTTERQRVTTLGGDYDVVGTHRDGSRMAVVVLHVRGGALVDTHAFDLEWELSEHEGLESFLPQFYGGEVLIPPRIVLPCPLEGVGLFEETFSERRGGKVNIIVPRRGDLRRLVDLAERNARLHLQEKLDADGRRMAVLAELARQLGLSVTPRRIECYDVSVFQGGEGVASGVVFTDGLPDRGAYRRYRIRSVEGTDDFAMMAEVIGRRFSDPDLPPPDLILVDGGIGQLNVVTRVLEEKGIDVPVASIAKSRIVRSGRGMDAERSEERIFLPGRKNPLLFPPRSELLSLLVRVRDEAHRFAITYHRQLRSRRMTRSALDTLPGMGKEVKMALLERFGSVEGIRNATVEELQSVRGVGAKRARTIREQLTAPEE